MAISASDLKIRYSVKTGSAGDSTSGTGAGSLGKYISTTDVPAGAGLFDDVSGAENAASTVDYRCVFALNTHATLTLQSAVAYLSAQVSGGTDCAIAVDNIAASAKGSSSAQAAEIANETAAPSGVGSYSAPTTAGTGLALGDLAPGQCRAIWVRRTATNSSAQADGCTVAISGDTAA